MGAQHEPDRRQHPERVPVGERIAQALGVDVPADGPHPGEHPRDQGDPRHDHDPRGHTAQEPLEVPPLPGKRGEQHEHEQVEQRPVELEQGAARGARPPRGGQDPNREEPERHARHRAGRADPAERVARHSGANHEHHRDRDGEQRRRTREEPPAAEAQVDHQRPGKGQERGHRGSLGARPRPARAHTPGGPRRAPRRLDANGGPGRHEATITRHPRFRDAWEAQPVGVMR